MTRYGSRPVRRAGRPALIAFGALAAAMTTMPGAWADDNGIEVKPSPPSIGADVPLTYFGPAPSDAQRELIGPFKVLKAGNVDLEKVPWLKK